MRVRVLAGGRGALGEAVGAGVAVGAAVGLGTALGRRSSRSATTMSERTSRVTPRRARPAGRERGRRSYIGGIVARVAVSASDPYGRVDPGQDPGPIRARIAFLIACGLDPESARPTVRDGRTHKVLSSLPPTGGADWAGASGLFDSPPIRRAGERAMQSRCVRIKAMEVTWYGRTCVRLRGKDAVVVTDPYQAVVGPTGRGITGDIVTFSHPDDTPLPRAKGKRSRDGTTLLPSSLDDAFVLDGPGEYEVKEVLVTGVRTYRDDARGAEGGKQVSFAVEVDGVHVAPPRRHRPPAVRGEARRHRRRWTSPACPLGGTLSADAGRRPRRPAGPEDRRPDADLRRRGRVRRGAGQVLPRDGRRAGRPSRSCR